MTHKSKPTENDTDYALIKGALGSIPVLGSLAAEIFGLVVIPPLEKRRTEWMNEIAQRLKDLEGKNSFDIDTLSKNEEFIDVILQSTTYALKTSQKEKIMAFQNAIINTALGDTPERSTAQIFLSLLDSFTIWHIKILKFFNNPTDWYKLNGKSYPDYASSTLARIVKEAFPEMHEHSDLLDLIGADLYRAKLLNTGDLRSNIGKNDLIAKRTTNFGEQFLAYISENSHRN